MYTIVGKKTLNPSVVMMEIEAPLVARAAHAGQFVILRPSESSERIPLTLAGWDSERGTVKTIFQTVGATTLELSKLGVGDAIADLAGPLGKPTELDGLSRVLVVGGGVGCAIALPIAEQLRTLGVSVTAVIGFRTRELVILEDEFSAACDSLTVVTDDGSYGELGNVCSPMHRMFENGEKFDKIFVIGPIMMMKYAVLKARPTGIPCTVSMNPLMIDGTGMCGGCRIILNKDGKRVTRFACVDGPDFDGYEVDFDSAALRGTMYRDFERHAYDAACNLFREENKNG